MLIRSRLELACHQGAPGDALQARLDEVLAQLVPVLEGLAGLGEVRGHVRRLPAAVDSATRLGDLRVTLEGTENRIAVARNNYIKTVQEYNVLVRQFPTNLTAMVMSYKAKPSFTVENEAAISRPPTVDFGTEKK